MTYWNPVLRYGVDAFARDLAAAGGLGLITPDLIPDEADEWLAASDAHGLDRIFLVAPSSTEERHRDHRRRHAAASSTPRSTMGVTGARAAVASAAPELVARCRAHTDVPSASAWACARGDQAAEVGGVRRRCHRRFGVWSPRPTEGGRAAWRALVGASCAEGRPVRRYRGTGDGDREPSWPTSRAPSQGVWYLGPVPLRAYALCIIAGHRRRRLCGASAGCVARGGTPGHGHRRRRLRGAVRAGRRPALPRRHRLADLLRPGRRPARRAQDLAGRPRDLGRRRARRRSGPGSAAAAAGSRCRRSRDAVAPGIVVAQAIGRLGNYFNQELYGDATTCPWGLEIYRAGRPGNGRAATCSAASRRPAPPIESCSRRSSTSCSGTSWSPRWWCGPTGVSGSATGARSRCTSRATRRAGSASS